MATIKMVKHDALIEIKIGTGFLQKLQQMLLFITKDVTTEDLEKYKQEAELKQDFSEEWMEHLTTMSILITEIETKAEEQGFIYENDMPSQPES